MRASSSPYKSPSVLLAELGVEQPEDIDVEAIAEYCGATAVYEDLAGCEARIVGSGERAVITVSKDAPRSRQRFSVGHELGHWMRDRGRSAFACEEVLFATEWHSANPERRANEYATELLLPEGLFTPMARNCDMTFATVRTLAHQFETSLTATAIRLVRLGSFPALIVCCGRDGRRWFIRGPDVPDIFWPRERPGNDAVARESLESSSRAIAPREVYADTWFDIEGADRYGVVEDSVKITPDLVLSLLWWKDEGPLLEFGDSQ